MAQAENTTNFKTQAVDSAAGFKVNGLTVIDESGNIDAPITPTLASGKIYVGSASNVAAAVTVSGDATMASTGALTVTDVTVGSDAAGDMLYKSSATALARLAKGTAGQMMLMDAGATNPSWVSMSGDVTMSNGVTSIGAGAVTLAKFGRSDAAGKFVIGQGASADAQYGTMSGDATLAGSGALTLARVAGDTKVVQASATAKTTSATLTAAEVAAGIITVNQGGGATSSLQLPEATAMDTQFTTIASGEAFDFSLINISTNGAEDADITTNTGWTLVGSMAIQSNDAITSKSSGRFRALKTGTGAWVLMRLS